MGFMSRSCSRPIRWRDVGFRSVWSVTKSARRSSSSSDTISMPVVVTKSAGGSTTSVPRTVRPNPPARRTTAFPQSPMPTTPRTHSPRETSWALRHCPAFISRSEEGTRRAKLSMYAYTVSATGSEKAFGVLQTRTPRRAAASRSMESMPVPHLERTRSRGAALRTRSENWSSPQITPSTSATSGSSSSSDRRSWTVAATTSMSWGSSSARYRSSTGIA